MYHVTQLTYIYAPLLAFTPSYSATYANQLIQLSDSVPRCGSRIFLEGWGVWGGGGGEGSFSSFSFQSPYSSSSSYSPPFSPWESNHVGGLERPPPGPVSTLDQPLSVPINAAFYHG